MEKGNYLNWAEIEPLCLLRRLLSKLWLIVLAVMIGVMAVSAYLLGDISRSYSSAATFVVTARSGNTFNTNVSAAAGAAGSFAELLQSEQMRQLIWDAAGDQAPGVITAQQLEDTNMIRVTVTADNPKDALQTIQALMDHYSILTDYAASDVVLSVMNSPTVSVREIRTHDPAILRRNAGLLCGGLMTGLLLWLFLGSETIQNVEGAKNRLDTKLLTSVPHDSQPGGGKRRGRRKKHTSILDPTTSFAFSESIHRIATHLEQQKGKGKSVFLFTSVTEREGKSTVAANTAMSLAAKKARVLLLDLDIRHPVQADILNMRVPADRDLVTLLRARTPALQILSAVQVEPRSGLYTLLSQKPYAKASDLLSSVVFGELIEEARIRFDYIIVDIPPVGCSSDGELLADLCDASVLVVRQDLVSASEINDAIDSIRSGRAELLGCVLNDVRYLVRSSSGYGRYGYGKYGYGKYGYGKYGYGGRQEQTRTVGSNESSEDTYGKQEQ